MHQEKPGYGRSAREWVATVRELAFNVPTKDILDYGCGKRVLEEALGADHNITNYDPAIPEFSKHPGSRTYDFVCCLDVMEHIEPDCLDDVLDDLARLTRRQVMITVCSVSSYKHLPDGRNTHLIQRPYEWWLPKIWSRFTVRQFNLLGPKFLLIGGPL